MGQAARKLNYRFFYDKSFFKSLQDFYQKSGQYQKKAERVLAVLGRIGTWNEDPESGMYPLEGFKQTNHGENRIKHCVKYDLGNGCRLITIQNNGICSLEFIGTHDECEKWLNKNKGYQLTADSDYRINSAYVSSSLDKPEERISSESDLGSGKLYEKLPKRYRDYLFEDIPQLVVRGLKELESTFIDNELEELIEVVAVSDEPKSIAILDVFLALRSGDIQKAKNRIDLYKNNYVLVEELDEEEIKILDTGQDFLKFGDFEGDFLKSFLNKSSFKEWMLFLHPEQQKIIEADYNGPAKLAGVSGSGKTAIIVKRAVRLAEIYPGEQILLVTLNKALANLIAELTDTACPDKKIREQIYIYSFWDLCTDELELFEKDIDKRLSDITWKREENVDEIWDEYYFGENNNKDAEVFYPVHKSLLSRNINPRVYIKQEFDWIRSAFAPDEREKGYMEVDREGRSEPLTLQYRELMLEGLKGWEQKMEDVGVTDYTGLAARLYRHMDQLKPRYRCILVDELQDFGTMELSILRKLVPEGENDMFLCGDIAQQVHTKHHKITHAGINVIGRSFKIKQNYRNSREILQASYEVLRSNINLDDIKTDDFEVIEPDYANFSTPKPLLLEAKNLEEELGYALSYIDEFREEKEKACIAFGGLSLHQVKALNQSVDVTVLDSATNIDEGNLFFSDLDQTKGFEFDIMVVLNCRDGEVPDLSLPEAEWHRDICKLYVAMTRAKKQLLISWHNKPSRIFEKTKEHFVADKWTNQVSLSSEYRKIEIKRKNKFVFDKKKDRLSLTGREFLYTDYAIGMPLEIQDKLLELVTGRNSTANGKTSSWRTVYDLYKDRDVPNASSRMGGRTYSRFKEFVDRNV